MVYWEYEQRKDLKMNKKIISLFLAAAMLLTAAGCSEGGGKEINDPVAYIENPPEGAGNRLNVSYSEWHNEYLFNMAKGGYDEETNADEAKSFKQSILDYLVQEHVILYLAEQEGITAEALTEEDIALIEENVQLALDSWCETYEADAKSVLGDSYTEEELYNKEFELFSAFMAESGLSPEIFYTWETNEVIRDKFIEKTSESISDDYVKEFVQETVDNAKNAYENDIAAFEQTYTAFYVPEGTRVVQQIYLKIDTDAANEIKAYRSDGDDAKADELLEAALEPIRPVIEEALEKLANGEDWLTVQKEYNQDGNGNGVDYVVYPTSSYILPEITQAAMAIPEKGGISEIIVSDSGLFILYYKDDRVFTDEEMQSLIDQARDFLKKEETYKRVNDFNEQYPYVFDYELMGLSAE